MPKTKSKKKQGRAERYRDVLLQSRADTIKELRGRITELESEVASLESQKDRPWAGYANGTRTGDRRILDSAQLRRAAQYFAENNEVHATGLMVILIEHLAMLAFKKDFRSLDSSIDTFRRWLCREQEAVLMMGIDHLRAGTFKRLSQSISADTASEIEELAQDLSLHSGRDFERELEVRSA